MKEGEGLEAFSQCNLKFRLLGQDPEQFPAANRHDRRLRLLQRGKIAAAIHVGPVFAFFGD